MTKKLLELFSELNPKKSKTRINYGYDYLVSIVGECKSTGEHYEYENGWLGDDIDTLAEQLTVSELTGIDYVRVLKMPAAGYTHSMEFMSYRQEGILQPFVTTNTGYARKPEKIKPLKRWDKQISLINQVVSKLKEKS
jgi:hypothetical protein